MNLTLKAVSVSVLGPSAKIVATLLAASNPKYLTSVNPTLISITLACYCIAINFSDWQ